ncbi:MAG: PIN domain-containing protein [Gammaproteobacteria bacterium]
MSARSFLDTNVLVYTDDHDTPDKQRVALDLVERFRLQRTGVVSTQVLQEYFAAATRKLKVRPDLARRKVEIFARLDLVQVDLDVILSAIDLHRLQTVSFWDALIVRAALASGCTVLMSEDLQIGQRFNGLQIVNPFA